MNSPEHLINEAVKHATIAKAFDVLETSEFRETTPDPVFQSGPLAGLEKVIRGQDVERSISLQIGSGYEWVELTEYRSRKFGLPIRHRLLISGSRVGDAEGRNIQKLWQFDLLEQTYDKSTYASIVQLIDGEQLEKDEAFRDITYRSSNQY